MKTIVLIFVSVAALLSAENSFAKESFDKMVPLFRGQKDQKDYEGYLKVTVAANFVRSENIEEKVFIVPIDKEYIQNGPLFSLSGGPAALQCVYEETFVTPNQESVEAHVYFAITPLPIDENDAAKDSWTFRVSSLDYVSKKYHPIEISITSPEEVNVSFTNSEIDGYVSITYHKGDIPETSSIKPKYYNTDQLTGVYLSEAIKGIPWDYSREEIEAVLKWHQNQTPGNSLHCEYFQPLD